MAKSLINIILAFALLCIAAKAKAEVEAEAEAEEPLLKSEYSYRRYTVSDGLPDLVTTSIYQDSKGFIWVGTVRGCARFDGHEFKSFDTEGCSIVRFIEYNHQIIGIGLKSSFLIDGNDLVTPIKMVYSESDIYGWQCSKSLPEGYAVYQIDDKVGIYSVTDTGLVKTWEHELLNKVTDGYNLYWDKSKRRFFIPTLEEGVYVVNENGTVENHFNVNGITNFISYENTVWAVGFRGLYKFNDDRLTVVLEYPFFNNESNDIQLLTDSERNLLIRTVSGLYRYSKGALEVITDQLMASNDLFVDKEGNIWVAASNGLYNYYKLNFKNYTLSKEGNMVHSIVVDKQNKVWMSTLDGEIIRIENSKAINIRFPAFPTEYSYFDKGSIAKDNLIYLTGGLGVLQYDCEKDKFQWLPDLPPKNLPLSNITDIAILPNSNLVIRSTTFSLIYHPKEGIKRIYKADELKQMIISSFVDKEGNILYYHN